MEPVSLILAAANLVPAIAKFLGAGDTTQKVAESVSAIATTVAGVADPAEAFTKIGQDPALQQQFKLSVMDRMKDWDAIYLADVQNARDRDIKLNAAGYRNSRANWLVIFAMLMVIGLIIICLKSANVPDWIQGIIIFALGRSWGYLDAIYNFEFGTTKQSKQKDDTIDKLTKQL